MNQVKVGKFIAELRKEKGLTQDEVAKKLGITCQSVSKWENGINSPDVILLLDLCEILDISVDELLTGERKSGKRESSKTNALVKKRNDVSNYSRFCVFSLSILAVTLIFAFGIFLINDMYNRNEKYKSIDKDDVLVKEALSYIDFSSNINKSLLQKLFDNNEDIITQDDLSDDEKMYLVLNKYKKDNSLDYYFQARSEDLYDLVFEDDTFLQNYLKDDVYYTIQNNVNFHCYKGIISYSEINYRREDSKKIYFDIRNVSKSEEKVIIDFKIAFLTYYEYSEFTSFYNDISGYNYMVQVKNDEEYGDLSDEFNTFRYTLKLKDDKVYFESIGRI